MHKTCDPKTQVPGDDGFIVYIYVCVCIYFFYKTPKSTGSFSTWLLSLHKNKHKKLAARIHSTELILGKAL